MCGRFIFMSPGPMVAEHFQLDETPSIEPRYNIAPSQSVAAVRIDRDSGRRRLRMLRWGLVPSWAKDINIGYKMINARSETLSEKPAFRTAFKRRRCLIPANGFYEWIRSGTTKKTPHLIRLSDEALFAFAGLWEVWKPPDGDSIESCTILTTSANELVQRIHDRMPVIVRPENYELRLDVKTAASEEIRPLLAPYPASEMIAFQVSPRVNKTANDDPELIKPMEE